MSNLTIHGLKGGRITAVHILQFAQDRGTPARSVVVNDLLKSLISRKENFSVSGAEGASVLFEFRESLVDIKFGYVTMTIWYDDLVRLVSTS